MVTGTWFELSLMYGAIFAVIFVGLILVSLRYNAEIWYNDYPEEAKAKHGPMSEIAKKQRTLFSVVFAAFSIGGPLLLIALIERQIGELNYPLLFGSVYLAFMLSNLLDTLFIDLLIGVTLDPRWGRLPGAVDGPSYQTARYHLMAFLKGTVMLAVLSAVFAGVGLLI